MAYDANRQIDARSGEGSDEGVTRIEMDYAGSAVPELWARKYGST